MHHRHHVISYTSWCVPVLYILCDIQPDIGRKSQTFPDTLRSVGIVAMMTVTKLEW